VREMNVADIIRLNSLSRPDSEALVVGALRITYCRYQHDIERTAAALALAGVSKGDRVAALGRNSYQYTLLYFALARLGAILVPLNFWHRSPELAHALADSEPAMVFVEPQLIGPLLPVLAELDFAVERIRLPEGADANEWDAFIDRAAAEPAPAAEIEPADPHMILYTSGTTGRPKGALLSHGRTVRDAMAMALAIGLRHTDTFLDYFPSFHVGNWDHFKMYLLVGGRVVLLREFDAGEIFAAIESERPTVLLGVPTMFHTLLDDPRREGVDLSCVRIVCYGAYDPSGLMREVARVFGVGVGGAVMGHTYGLTEAGPFVSYCPPEDLDAHWGSIGRPIAGVEVALLDDELTEVEVGKPGEICVRGPHMSGYWRNPEATAEALAGGWLHSGDMAVRDEEGFMTIVDRKKDMIRSGGQNVYSKEVEDCLSLHPGVDEAAVVGIPDAVYEEAVCAVVVPLAPAQAGSELAVELTAHVRERLAGYNTPKRIEFVAALPKNAVGKTEKHKLRDELAARLDVEAGAGA
jgi:fatty-acyl-CoA synthase